MKTIALMLVVVSLSIPVIAQQPSTPAAFKTGMNNVYKKYMDVESALQAGNTTLAKQYANQLLLAARAVSTNGLGYGQTQSLNKNLLLITANAQLMLKNNRLDSQLKLLDEITAGLYPILKDYKIAVQPVYYDYCPKANNGGGAHWLTSSADLKNPYMRGDVMGCEKQQDKF